MRTWLRRLWQPILDSVLLEAKSRLMDWVPMIVQVGEALLGAKVGVLLRSLFGNSVVIHRMLRNDLYNIALMAHVQTLS